MVAVWGGRQKYAGGRRAAAWDTIGSNIEHWEGAKRWPAPASGQMRAGRDRLGKF